MCGTCVALPSGLTMMARLANLLMLISSMPPTPTQSLRIDPAVGLRNNPHRSRVHDQQVLRGSWDALGNVAAGHGIEDAMAALTPPSPPSPIAAKTTKEAPLGGDDNDPPALLTAGMVHTYVGQNS